MWQRCDDCMIMEKKEFTEVWFFDKADQLKKRIQERRSGGSGHSYLSNKSQFYIFIGFLVLVDEKQSLESLKTIIFRLFWQLTGYAEEWQMNMLIKLILKALLVGTREPVHGAFHSLCGSAHIKESWLRSMTAEWNNTDIKGQAIVSHFHSNHMTHTWRSGVFVFRFKRSALEIRCIEQFESERF